MFRDRSIHVQTALSLNDELDKNLEDINNAFIKMMSADRQGHLSSILNEQYEQFRTISEIFYHSDIPQLQRFQEKYS